ncbi:MAG: radical SAM protein, partial [Rhizobiales bacterium]|nr:radical SAM protein [Hyphomicrobiales bacterium]
DEADARAGYQRLAVERGWPVDAANQAELVLFPEMDAGAEVPEITTECWSILGVDPGAMMCASSRMVVKTRGAGHAHVVPCTLLPYDPQFNMGATLGRSLEADGGAFDHGRVRLNHPHCTKFCVLGGGSCSAAG